MSEQKEQFEKEEEIVEELTAPVEQPAVVSPVTKRKTPIIRYNAVPLQETHGMTTEAGRFKSS